LDAAIDSTWCGCCQYRLSVGVGGKKLHNAVMFRISPLASCRSSHALPFFELCLVL
jgi:hypothetical protein